MSMEQIAFRRGALGVPISRYPALLNRARVNGGGVGSGAVGQAQLSDISSGVLLTSSATPHAVGVWTELLAAQSYDAEMIVVELTGIVPALTNTNTLMLLDIGYGPDDTTVTEVCYHFPLNHLGSGRWLWPIRIPNGNKIFGRIQALQVSDTVTICIRSIQQGFALPSVKGPAVVYGVNPATSQATNTVSTAAVNTKTAFDTLATTTQPHNFFTSCVVGPSTSTITTQCDSLYDFAYVKDSVDTIFFNDIWATFSTAESLALRDAQFFPVAGPWPAGTVLRFRHAVSVAGISRPAVAVVGW